jgi:hypothetical protein
MCPIAQHRRPHRRASHVAALAVAVALAISTGAACFHRRSGESSGASAEEAEEAAQEAVRLPEYVFVDVQNRNSSDVTVHLIQANGQPLRIGNVPGSTNATLRFPGRLIAGGSSLRLTARSLGGSDFVTSDRFVVQPGQQVVWSLESALRRSSVAVY